VPAQRNRAPLDASRARDARANGQDHSAPPATAAGAGVLGAEAASADRAGAPRPGEGPPRAARAGWRAVPLRALGAEEGPLASLAHQRMPGRPGRPLGRRLARPRAVRGRRAMHRTAGHGRRTAPAARRARGGRGTSDRACHAAPTVIRRGVEKNQRPPMFTIHGTLGRARSIRPAARGRDAGRSLPR
jgi:hypothetical protein